MNLLTPSAMLGATEITLNIFILGGIILASLVIGIMLKNAKLHRLRQGVEKLEKEMLNSHAEILRLQKELAVHDVHAPQAPIVPMQNNLNEMAKENLPDASMRKKALSGLGTVKS